MFFVKLVTHPKSYIETTDPIATISAANRQSEGETAAIVKNSGIL